MVRSRIRKQQISSDSDTDTEILPPSRKRSRGATITADEVNGNLTLDVAASTSAASGKRIAPANTNASINNRCSSIGKPSYGIKEHNPFSRCGKIMSMRLKNFMCHSNLYIEFGPNINFLVGSNGSGKSAVITALALGLASSARSTSRASSIQKLIKNGETTATIELTLCNTGVRPYKAETYGPQITVVRHIRQSSSTYDIKDAHNRIVSKKLDELRRMLLYFCISVDNPIFVLNQEASREFLKDLEPSSNYKLLMKATQLDLCATSLTQCHEYKDQFDHDIELLKMQIKQADGQCQAEQEKLKILENKETIKIQLQNANAMLAWLKVTRIQEDLTKMEHTLKIVEQKNLDLSQKTTLKTKTQETLSQQLGQCNEANQEITSSYQTQAARLRAVEKTVEDCMRRSSSIHASIRNVEKRLKEEHATYTDCQKHMQNYNAEYLEVQRLRDLNNATLASLKEKLERNKVLIAQLQEEQCELKNSLPTAKEQLSTIRSDLNNIRNSEYKLQSEIDTLLRNKSNKMSVYGENAMKVAIALKSKYSGNLAHRMPRGPIGMYITVPNAKYRDLIENQLGACLRSYIVNSSEDRLALRAILQKTYTGNIPTIITSSFTNSVYNVSQHRVQANSSNTTVLMDEIRCEDPVVMNYLIDAFRIETVLVTHSKEIAESLTSHAENVPPNLSRILVPNFGLEYCPSPNYAMYSIRISQARFIQVNVDDRIEQLKIEQHNLQQRGMQVQPHYVNVKSQLDIHEAEINKKKELLDAHHNDNTKIMRKIMDIENHEYRELPAHDVLQTHLTNSAEKIDKFKEEKDTLNNQLVEINDQKIRAESQVSSEKAALNEIKQNVAEIQNKANDLQNKLRSLNVDFEANQRRFKQTSELMKSMLKNKKDLEMDLEKARGDAKQVGEFVRTEKNEEQIQESISKYKAKIKHFDSMKLNADEVKQKLNGLENKLEQLKSSLTQIISIVDKLKISYRTRALRFQSSRNHLFTMIQFQFQQALSCHANFNGDLNADHREKTLDISVYPPSGNKTSNTRSLSGGERSFTTVSLLKGLWSTSDHPFYFLDEYDVFTDEVNRAFITKMLIQEGDEFRDRQYCFLTPQDTKVEANQLITVHKLETPEH